MGVMAKKSITSIDLATCTGSLMFKPGLRLPRHDKHLLNLAIAESFLSHLSDQDGSVIDEIKSIDNDPPDVTFTYNGVHCGMELTELLPVNRLEKDDIIRRLKRNIVSQLCLSTQTCGYVVNIFLQNDYAGKLRPGHHIHTPIAAALNAFFSEPDHSTEHIDVPSQLQHVVSQISVYKADLAEDLRIKDENEPLIVFGAQNTSLIPEEDCPSIVQTRLSKKGLHSFEMPTWLVLWSNHYALRSLRNELDDAIGDYLKSHPMKYERRFHFHLFSGSGATEFLDTQCNDPSGNNRPSCSI